MSSDPNKWAVDIILANQWSRMPHTIHTHGIHKEEMDGVFENINPGGTHQRLTKLFQAWQCQNVCINAQKRESAENMSGFPDLTSRGSRS
jgi:hypothetical protein